MGCQRHQQDGPGATPVDRILITDESSIVPTLVCPVRNLSPPRRVHEPLASWLWPEASPSNAEFDRYCSAWEKSLIKVDGYTMRSGCKLPYKSRWVFIRSLIPQIGICDLHAASDRHLGLWVPRYGSVQCPRDWEWGRPRETRLRCWASVT